MLGSYLKIAWKVLLRRKFFTFISLFGISLTLAVLMVATALLDHVFAPHPPEPHLDRTLGIHLLALHGEESRRSGLPGYGFLDRYARDLPGVERTSLYTFQEQAVSYVGGDKVVSWLKRTDGEFWQILDFRFLEGGPFTAHDEANRNFVAVINETTRDRFFGAAAGPAPGQGTTVGRTLEVNGQRFRVVGVVEDVPFLRVTPFADVWVPISTQKSSGYRHELTGDFQAILLAESRAALPGIREAFDERLARVQLPDPEVFQRVEGGAETWFESLSRSLFSTGFEEARPGLLRGILLGAAFLFMILPAVNLVNLNLSRILERTSEIGVRKAFGGSRWTLVGQFLVENVVLTLVGAALGLALAAAALSALEAGGLIPYAELGLNLRIFAAGVGLALFFGLLSGVYPAWRMARFHPVEALRGRSL